MSAPTETPKAVDAATLGAYICWMAGETSTSWHKATTAEEAAHKHAHYCRGHMTEATRYFAVNCEDATDSFGGTFEIAVSLVDEGASS